MRGRLAGTRVPKRKGGKGALAVPCVLSFELCVCRARPVRAAAIVDQDAGCSTASMAMEMVTSSPSTAPPPSAARFHDTP